MTAEELAAVVRVRAMCRSGEAAQIRHEARATTTEIARVLGVSKVAVHKWETGQSMPRTGMALRFGELLDQLRESACTGWPG